MNKILVFSHIPKTAGTSLTFLLKKNFGWDLLAAKYRKGSPQAAYVYPNLKKDLWIYPTCRCITGHTMKPYIDFLEYESSMVWFTFLRNPINRFVSHYIHQQENEDPKFNMELRDWAKKFQRSNWMVRMIAGEENLAKAIEILETKIQFIGITEKFDESLWMMKSQLALGNFDINYGRRKMTSKNNNLKKNIFDHYHLYEECIQQHNSLDIQLYQYVLKELWPKQRSNFLKTNSFPSSPKITPVNAIEHLKLYKYQLKNNLIYKPYVKLFG